MLPGNEELIVSGLRKPNERNCVENGQQVSDSEHWYLFSIRSVSFQKPGFTIGTGYLLSKVKFLTDVFSEQPKKQSSFFTYISKTGFPFVFFNA
jgi:hypothetical protein